MFDGLNAHWAGEYKLSTGHVRQLRAGEFVLDRGSLSLNFLEPRGARCLSSAMKKSEGSSMPILPVERALRIYGAIADRSEVKGSREQLSTHLMKLYLDGERNEHRLTVHGLTYLSQLDRQRDSRG